MSSNPLDPQSATNAALRPYYGTPIQFEICIVKDGSQSAWVMRETIENRARYNALFDQDPNPPSTRQEALERAGATFFPRCEFLLCHLIYLVSIIH